MPYRGGKERTQKGGLLGPVPSRPLSMVGRGTFYVLRPLSPIDLSRFYPPPHFLSFFEASLTGFRDGPFHVGPMLGDLLLEIPVLPICVRTAADGEDHGQQEGQLQ